MALGDVVNHADRVDGRWYKWCSEAHGMIEVMPNAINAYCHGAYSGRLNGGNASHSKTYTPWNAPKMWDGLDRARWKRTWGFLVRFSLAPDFHQNTRFASSAATKAVVRKDDDRYIWKENKWMTKAEWTASLDKLDEGEYPYGSYT